MEPPAFSNPEEEIIFWKKIAKEYLFRANTVQQELDEYTEGSQQLEKELETALDQSEKSNRDLKLQNQRFQNEVESLRIKLEQSNREINFLECEVKSLKADKERQGVYIRELEQKNDDLERAQRVITESVAGIETLLHQSYERNAVLEGEVDEVDTLKMKLQRAVDEARDLRQELLVTKYKSTNGNVEAPTDNDRFVINGHATTLVESETQTNLSGTPIKREYVVNGNTLTPSSRVSAMNIIGDLLRKVGLEKFLCPDCDKVRCICQKEEKQTADFHTSPDSEMSADHIVSANKPPIDSDDNVQLRKLPDRTSPVSLAQLDACKRATVSGAPIMTSPAFIRQTSLGEVKSPLPKGHSRLPLRVPLNECENRQKATRTSVTSSPGFVRTASTRLKEKSAGFFTRSSLRKPLDTAQMPQTPTKQKKPQQM